MNAITLTYNGVEKFIGDWGYSAARLNLRSRAASAFTLRKVNADPAAPADINYLDQVVIRMDRAIVNGAWGGGTVIFKGRRVKWQRQAHPDMRGADLLFADAWYDLEKTPFQHFWRIKNNDGSYTDFPFSRINLFQDISGGPAAQWGYLTTAQQIVQIVDYAKTKCGIQIQIGTIDPVWNVPMYGISAISCADALLMCLKPVPDCEVHIDYATNPPTIHFRQRANGTPVSLPYNGTDGQGRNHTSSDIESREDLIASQVVIQYQQDNKINGVSNLSYFNDAWPLNSTGQAIDALVVPIDLRGGNTSDVFGFVASQNFDATTTAFWKAHKPDLADISISGLAIIQNDPQHPITVKDANGADVNLVDYPYELLPRGGVASWMTLANNTPVKVKEVVVSAFASWTKLATTGGGFPTHIADFHPVSCRLKLTNSPPGPAPDFLVNYSALAHNDPGEGRPLNLARNTWEALATVQWEGTHEIVEMNISTFNGALLSPAHVLNLSGGAVAWQTMNAAIYDVEYDFFEGRTTVSFGPNQMLSPAEFFQYVMMWRYRRVYDNPAIRNTGDNGTSAGVELTKDAARENTNEGEKSLSLHTVYSQPDINGNQTVIQHNATEKQIILRVLDGSGVPEVIEGSVILDLDDLNGQNRDVKFRPLVVCVIDPNTQVVSQMKCWVPCTLPEAL